MNRPIGKQLIQLTLAFFLLGVSALGASDVYAKDKPKSFAKPEPVGDAAQFGANIQRTMTLLATSTPQKRNRVRILFYGQSVTRGAWWKNVAADLRARFPHADLEIENRAVGGYGGPVLINTAQYDLYPFYPDLVIFHVWSGVESGHQEEIIRRIRSRTTAEVLLWTSNLRWPIWSVAPDGDPQHADVRYIEAQDQAISDLYFRLGQKFHCEVADVRSGMKAYLAKHNRLVKDTIVDSVHPNNFGNFLIAELVKPHLRYCSTFPDNNWKDLVTDIPVDDPRVNRAADGSLSLDFNGNRIDVIAAADAKDTTAAVLIDGKRPSENPRLYYHARPTLAPGAGRPSINRIDHKTPLQVETWTARIIECDLENDVLRSEIIGSKTGPDGSGDHKKRFVSNSGRVIIEPGMWMLNWSLRYCKLKLPQDFKVTWQTLPLFLDTWKAPADVDPTSESVATLAQGLKNAKHSVTLKPTGDGTVRVKAFRVYQPPQQ